MYIQNLMEILAAEVGQPFDYPTQLIARDLAITARATLVRQNYQKTGIFPTSASLSFCVPFTLKSSTECCGTDLGCELPVSEVLPVPLDVDDKTLFAFVGGITLKGTKKFGYIKPDEIDLIKFRKFSSHLIYYTWYDRRLVILGDNALEKAKVRYVPSNPIEVLDFRTCDNKPCYDLETFVFIEDNWRDTITKMVIPELRLILNQQVPVDEQTTKN